MCKLPLAFFLPPPPTKKKRKAKMGYNQTHNLTQR